MQLLHENINFRNFIYILHFFILLSELLQKYHKND